VAAIRLVSVIGRKNAGKTTLTVALAAEFGRRGRRVMTIKHASDPMPLDREGTDSYRHFHEGRAARTLLVGPTERLLLEREPDSNDPVALARQYLDGADIVLVEGYKRAPVPKIEIIRGGEPIYRPDHPLADDWLAIVTDGPRIEARCPVLRFQDTMWMQLLANMAWDGAKVLPT